jgi:phosphatidylglycerophosphatase C
LKGGASTPASFTAELPLPELEPVPELVLEPEPDVLPDPELDPGWLPLPELEPGWLPSGCVPLSTGPVPTELLLEQWTSRRPVAKAMGEATNIQDRVIGRASRRRTVVAVGLEAKKEPTSGRGRVGSLAMELLAAEAVVARIAEARLDLAVQTRGAALAFDGDGTLWSGDIGDDFFHRAVEVGRFLPPAVDAMRAVGHAAGLDDIGGGHDAGVAIARSLFQGYLDHKVAEDVICEVIAWICAGWREEEVSALARDVVVRGGLASRLHREVCSAVEWARGAGLEAFLVSASPRPVVEAASAALGFDRDHVIATTARFSEGVMLPEVVRPIPYGPGKASLLEERLAGRVLLAAFGDNIFDVPMLEAARVAVIVEPKPRLLAHLALLEERGEAFGGGRPPIRVRVEQRTP